HPAQASCELFPAARKTQDAGACCAPRSARLRRRRLFELELFDAITNLIAIQAQQARGARLIPAASLERLHDERPFELLEIEAPGSRIAPLPPAPGARVGAP